MRAPFHFQFEMVGCNSPASFLISDARVDQVVHPQDYLIGGQAAGRLHGAAELSIYNIADAFQHAAHETLRQDRVASSLGGLVLLVSHGSEYEYPLIQVQTRSL